MLPTLMQIATTDSIQVSLNQDLINVNHWLIVNKLTLDTPKTVYKVNTQHTLPSLEINGSPINTVNYLNYIILNLSLF